MDIVDFVLHSDKHLQALGEQYGVWIYAILFVIVFAERGFVVTPFLPGDSLLFAVGALCAAGRLNPWLAFGLLAGAAFAGNMVNYWIGRAIGPKVVGTRGRPGTGHRLVKQEHVKRAQEFFDQYGGKAVV